MALSQKLLVEKTPEKRDTMNLMAKWEAPNEGYENPPDIVRWSNGTAATLGDYELHRFDTRQFTDKGAGGYELYIWLDVVAEVYFCPWGRTWGIRGRGVESQSLNLANPDASDDQIGTQMCMFEISYRYTVTRQPIERRLSGKIPNLIGSM